MAGGAPIDGAEAILGGYVRGDAKLTHAGHEAPRVVALVGAHAEAPAAPGALLAKQPQTGLTLGGPRSLRELDLDDESVAVLGEGVAGVAELGLLAIPLARQPGLRVRGGAVASVAAALAVEVDVGVTPAAACWRLLALVLAPGPQVLERGGRLDQGAVDAEVLAGQQLMRLGLVADGGEEGLRDLGREQAVAVLGEAGRMEDRLIEGQAHEPAQQQVVAQLLDEASFGGDRVEDLDELGAQQILGGDRRAAAGGVEVGKRRAHLGKGGVDHRADRAQRMIRRHDVLESRHDDEPGLHLLVSAHSVLPIRDLQGLFYQRRAARGSTAEAADPRRTSQPATISAAC